MIDSCDYDHRPESSLYKGGTGSLDNLTRKIY